MMCTRPCSRHVIPRSTLGVYVLVLAGVDQEGSGALVPVERHQALHHQQASAARQQHRQAQRRVSVVALFLFARSALAV